MDVLIDIGYLDNLSFATFAVFTCRNCKMQDTSAASLSFALLRRQHLHWEDLLEFFT